VDMSLDERGKLRRLLADNLDHPANRGAAAVADTFSPR
jgi:hypothetical protein